MITTWGSYSWKTNHKCALEYFKRKLEMENSCTMVMYLVLKNNFKNRIFLVKKKKVHVCVCATVQAHMSECIIAIY